MMQRTHVRMNAGLDKHWRWRGSSSRVQVYTTTSYIDFPNAKVMRINERNHYDWDLLKYRATHLRKVFPAAEMRLVSSVGFSSTVLQPPIDKGLQSIHSCSMAGDCLTGTSLGCITEKTEKRTRLNVFFPSGPEGHPQVKGPQRPPGDPSCAYGARNNQSTRPCAA